MSEKPTYYNLEQRVREIEETALRDSEERFRTVMEQFPLAIEIYDSSGKLLIVNDEWELFWNLKRRDVEKFNIFDDKECARTRLTLAFKKALKGIASTISSESHCPKERGKPDGSKRWINFKMYPVKNQHGGIKNIVLVMEDISEHKLAEEILKKAHDELECKVEERTIELHNVSQEHKKVEGSLYDSKLQFEVILNNLDAMIYITDMVSHEILFMNNHMKKKFGKDLTGNICWKVFHDNYESPCNFCTNGKLINVNGNPNEPYVWEFYNQKFDIWQEKRDQAIPWADGRLVRMEIATDITARKQIELDLKGYQNLLEKKVKERTSELEDMNTSLKVLLKKREDDKDRIGEQIFTNFKLLLSPMISNLKKNLTQGTEQEMLNLLELELNDIISPFSKMLSDPIVGLTPAEIQIASLIKEGKSNKEISSYLNKSIFTVCHHRDNIREKLDLKNKKINLRAFLSSLSY